MSNKTILLQRVELCTECSAVINDNLFEVPELRFDHMRNVNANLHFIKTSEDMFKTIEYSICDACLPSEDHIVINELSHDIEVSDTSIASLHWGDVIEVPVVEEEVIPEINIESPPVITTDNNIVIEEVVIHHYNSDEEVPVTTLEPEVLEFDNGMTDVDTSVTVPVINKEEAFNRAIHTLTELKTEYHPDLVLKDKADAINELLVQYRVSSDMYEDKLNRVVDSISSKGIQIDEIKYLELQRIAILQTIKERKLVRMSEHDVIKQKVLDTVYRQRTRSLELELTR